MSIMNCSVPVEENAKELLRLVQLAESMGGKLSIGNSDLSIMGETIESLLSVYLSEKFTHDGKSL